MSYTDQKPSNLPESFENIPSIDDETEGTGEIFAIFLSGFNWKINYFTAVIEDSSDRQMNNISNANVMGSKSMDSISSEPLDGEDQGERRKFMTL